MMADEPPVESLHFTQHTVFVVEDWPQRIQVLPEFLQNPHIRGAAYDPVTETLEFSVFNGGALYVLDPPGGSADGARLATLVPDSARKTTRRP